MRRSKTFFLDWRRWHQGCKVKILDGNSTFLWLCRVTIKILFTGKWFCTGSDSSEIIEGRFLVSFCTSNFTRNDKNFMLTLLPTDTCYWLAWEFNEQDYQEIYRLKWRDFMKPLAWLVEDYEDLKIYIEITDEQIDFLKKYHRPWSILGKRRADYVLPDFLDEKQYEKISFRVASECLCNNEKWSDPVFQKPELPRHLPQKREDSSQWQVQDFSFPLFLTSANLSGMPESKTLAEARELFPWVEGINGGLCDIPPSDIFEFQENGEIVYLRRS